MSLLQMSFSGALIIVAIVIIRALAINRLPKKAFLILWGIALARLLIPFSLPSAFSVYSLMERAVPVTETPNNPPFTQVVPIIPATLHTIPETGAPVTPTPSAPSALAFSVDSWTVVWMIGAVACAVFFIVAYLKYRREFKASIPVVSDYAKLWLAEHQLRRTIEIRQSDKISTPLTYGVFHPVILMPKNADWNDQDSMKYVLTHEYVHICRFDTLTKLVLTVALCVHWINPAVWVMYILANRDIELSCDEAVVRLFGEHTKSAYALTLIRMAEAKSGLTSLSSNFSKNAIEERIVAIMKMKKTSLVALFSAAALVVGIVVAFATSALGVTADNESVDVVNRDTSTVSGNSAEADALLPEAIEDKGENTADMPIVASNDLDRALCDLAAMYSEQRHSVSFSEINEFLINDADFSSVKVDKEQAIQLLREGFDLGGVKEHILIHLAIAEGAQENGLNLNMTQALKAIEPFREERYEYLLLSIAKHRNPLLLSMIQSDEIQSMNYLDDCEYSSNGPIVLLCTLYPGFLPENGAKTFDAVTEGGKKCQLSFKTTIQINEINNLLIVFQLDCEELSYRWEYTVQNEGAVKTSGSVSYEAALNEINSLK